MNNNQIEFNKIEFMSIPFGKQAIIYFNNGYGASIVCSMFSYGGKKGQFELAVLLSDGSITYDTKITNDVLGFLSENEVEEVLKSISKLPSRLN